MKKFSDILHYKNLKMLSFIFFNLGNQKTHNGENDEYEIVIAYRLSKFSEIDFSNDLAKANNDLLQNYTGLSFEVTTNTEKTIKHSTVLKNDTPYSREELLYRIYARIEQTRFLHPKREFEKIITSSFFIPRGSIDLSRNYFTVDVLKQNVSEQYIGNLLSLLTSLTEIKQLNFNFRELQPEYIEGKNRNTQLRINLRWFYDYYIDEVESLNLYKHNLLESNRREILLSNYNNNLSSSFIERAIFYKDKILGRQSNFEKLSKQQLNNIVKNYREELDFDDKQPETDKVYRDQSLVKLAIISQPDICHSCHGYYPLEQRTFKVRGSDRPYLELHHVISFGADQSGDVLENLVKLCPSCHRALTPNRAEEHYQKRIINDIFSHSQDAYKYVRLFLNERANENDAIEFVYQNLR